MNEPSSEAIRLPPAAMERIGGFLFRWRNLVFTVVLCGLLVGFRPVPLAGSSRLDAWLDVAGFVIAFLGQGLRAAVIGYVYIVRGGRKGKVYADRLVTEGFFNHARNPLYLGNLLVLTGLFMIHNNPWSYVVGLPVFLFAYAAIVAAEEGYLYRQFGAEYREYCRRVARWIPDFRGLRRTVAGMQFNWQRVLVKEYSSTYTWLVAALGIQAYEALLEPPSPQRNAVLAILAGLFALLTALWFRVRTWKKLEAPHDL
jgi:protein-S-isoprenylcysteine O-methyltransferase Ste14